MKDQLQPTGRDMLNMLKKIKWPGLALTAVILLTLPGCKEPGEEMPTPPEAKKSFLETKTKEEILNQIEGLQTMTITLDETKTKVEAVKVEISSEANMKSKDELLQTAEKLIEKIEVDKPYHLIPVGDKTIQVLIERSNSKIPQEHNIKLDNIESEKSI